MERAAAAVLGAPAAQAVLGPVALAAESSRRSVERSTAMDDISASLEDYLEMIFILHRKGESFYIAYKDNRFVHFSVYDKPYACGSYAYSCGAYACIFIWTE